MKYFGTDGIRGVANTTLSVNLCLNCGLALTKLKENPKIILATDTRQSRDMISFALISGVLSGGGDVVDIGIAPTSMVSLLTTMMGFDFGVMISASHNPKEYNGIKIFGNNGLKLEDSEEQKIEYYISNAHNLLKKTESKIGSYQKNNELQKKYIDHLIKNVNVRLNGLKVVLDLSNGASFKVAPLIYSSLGADVVVINDYKKGEINENCGSQYLSSLKEKVLLEKADIGIAFDGDADRIMCVDRNGKEYDGDAILYILANSFNKRNLLKGNSIVGTIQTNLSIEKKLKTKHLNFYRSSVGDKYVMEKMNEVGSNLGGEQSGHIIIKDIINTGDGLLSGLKLLEVMKLENKSLDELFNVKLMPQACSNIIVKDKERSISSVELNFLLNTLEKDFDGRIIVRKSGTENKIRVMVESNSKNKNKEILNKIIDIIKKEDI